MCMHCGLRHLFMLVFHLRSLEVLGALEAQRWNLGGVVEGFGNPSGFLFVVFGTHVHLEHY